LSKMKRLTLSRCAAMLATGLIAWALSPEFASPALAQDQPQGTSRGENFSAKPPAQLFATDCTGSGCHKGPQGLGRSHGFGGLASFLREHYTNSRESAAALANYLSKLPSAPEPREARTPRSGKPATAAPTSSSPGWFEGAAGESKPSPNEARAPRQTPAGQNASAPSAPGRTSREAVKPDEEPAAEPVDPAAKPAEAPPKPNPTARAQRGRQPVTATATVAAPASPPPLVPEVVPEAAPAAPPPEPAPPPPPKQFDIFD